MDLAPPSPNFPLPQPQYSTQVLKVSLTEVFLKSPSPIALRITSVKVYFFPSTQLSCYINNIAHFRGIFT